MSKFCPICHKIRYDDDAPCDCYSPQKIRERQNWEKEQEQLHKDWEEMRKQGKKSKQMQIKDEQLIPKNKPEEKEV